MTRDRKRQRVEWLVHRAEKLRKDFVLSKFRLRKVKTCDVVVGHWLKKGVYQGTRVELILWHCFEFSEISQQLFPPVGWFCSGSGS